MGKLGHSTTELNEWTPIGRTFYDTNIPAMAYHGFAGTFDGGEHAISGVYINSANVANQGLFGYIIDTATVKNIAVTESYIKGGSMVGGLVGWSNGTVEKCYNTADVTGTNLYVGGVAGNNSKIVQNCFNTGKVTGDRYIGGVVGYSTDTVESCYNAGSVIGNTLVGGVIGENDGIAVGTTVTGCYYDSTVCDGIDGLTGTPGTAIGKSTTWMKNATYPYLKVSRTVSYSLNYTGAGAHTTQTVTQGAVTTAPAAPTRSGYTLAAGIPTPPATPRGSLPTTRYQ